MNITNDYKEAINYLFGVNNTTEVDKNLLLNHDFAKMLFGHYKPSSHGLENWEITISNLAICSDVELTKFFISLSEYYKTVDKFKEVGIDFTDGKKPSTYGNGILSGCSETYEYFVPMYNYLESIGFKIKYKYHGINQTSHRLGFVNSLMNIDMVLENNPFHSNWWSGSINNCDDFRNDMTNPNEFIKYIDAKILSSYLELSGTEAERDFKTYTLLNKVGGVVMPDYLKDLKILNSLD